MLLKLNSESELTCRTKYQDIKLKTPALQIVRQEF